MASNADKPLKVDEKKHEKLKAQGFQKGKSGNPDGRPPMPEILKTKFEDFAEEGANILFDLIRNGKNEMVRMRGIEMIASYIMPKAAQKIDVDIQVTHTDTFLAEMAARHNIIAAQVAAPLLIDGELVHESADDE